MLIYQSTTEKVEDKKVQLQITDTIIDGKKLNISTIWEAYKF